MGGYLGHAWRLWVRRAGELEEQVFEIESARTQLVQLRSSRESQVPDMLDGQAADLQRVRVDVLRAAAVRSDRLADQRRGGAADDHHVGSRGELLDRAGADQLPTIEDDDTVGDLLHLAELVARHQHGPSLVGHVAEESP